MFNGFHEASPVPEALLDRMIALACESDELARRNEVLRRRLADRAKEVRQ